MYDCGVGRTGRTGGREEARYDTRAVRTLVPIRKTSCDSANPFVNSKPVSFVHLRPRNHKVYPVRNGGIVESLQCQSTRNQVAPEGKRCGFVLFMEKSLSMYELSCLKRYNFVFLLRGDRETTKVREDLTHACPSHLRNRLHTVVIGARNTCLVTKRYP